MTTDIDHAMRAAEALAHQTRWLVAEYLSHRKGRRKSPGYAASCLQHARKTGASYQHFKHLVQSEIDRLCGKPQTPDPKCQTP